MLCVWVDLRKTDTGWYTCKASSETGETTWSAALVVETPTDPSIIFHRTPEPTTFPGPPSKPSVSDVTETTARVTWRANPSHGASPVHCYTVEYFSHETGDVRLLMLCVCHRLIPAKSAQPCNLRPRRHSFSLTQKLSSYDDCNFITHMVFYDIYWLSVPPEQFLSMTFCSCISLFHYAMCHCDN